MALPQVVGAAAASQFDLVLVEVLLEPAASEAGRVARLASTVCRSATSRATTVSR
jgi:hypothetical protein